MGTMVTATVDFGSTPIDEATFIVTDGTFSGLTYAEAFFMSDSTTDNSVTEHRQAASLIRLTCSAPSGSDVTLHANVLAGYVTGTFKVRVVAN